MKSLVLALFTLCIAIVSNAQIPAGTKLIGGSLGFSHQEQENGSNAITRSTSFSISPTLGKAIKNNAVNGFSLSYGYNTTKSISFPPFTNQSIGLVLFKQKYLPLGHSFMAFGEGNVGGNYDWRKSDFKAYRISAGLGGGLAYNANGRLLLSLKLPNALNMYASSSKQKVFNSPSIRSFSTGVNTNISFQTFQFGVQLMCK